MRRIYVASSWRNPDQPRVVELLRAAGHEVYDFRNPSMQGPPGAPESGFAWSEIDPRWQEWTPVEYRAALDHPLAQEGFRADFAAMQWADTFLLLQPCGRSAHLEAGWAAGAGRRAAAWYPDTAEVEPELMIAMCNGGVLIGWGELEDWAFVSAAAPPGEAAEQEEGP